MNGGYMTEETPPSNMSTPRSSDVVIRTFKNFSFFKFEILPLTF
jgi:hypothetical protein